MIPTPIIKKRELAIILRNIARNIAYGTKFTELETDLKMGSIRILSVDKFYIYTILVYNYYKRTFKQLLKKQRVLRKIECFVLPRVFTNYGKWYGFFFYVAHIYNMLPDRLLYLQSLKIVTRELREWCNNFAA